MSLVGLCGVVTPARWVFDESLLCLVLVSSVATLPTGLTDTIMFLHIIMHAHNSDAPVMAHKLPNSGARGFVTNHDPLRADVAILAQLLQELVVLPLRHRSIDDNLS